MPSAPAGSYHLIFATDQSSAGGTTPPQAVTNLADTTTAVPITVTEPNVDLVMTGASVSSPIVVGDGGAISVSWTVQNQGTDTANNPWSDAIYLSTQPTLTSGATLLTTMQGHQGPLGPGQSYTVSFSGNGFPNTPTGAYYILFEADYDNTQGQTSYVSGADDGNLGNSVFPVQVQLNSPGNVVLSVTASAPSQAAVGSNVQVQWTVTNNGAAAADGNWQDSVYLSPDPTLDANAILLGAQGNGQTLDPGASYTQNDNFNLPAIPYNQLGSGQYYILVVTDSDNGQAVSSTSGDVASVPIQLSYPNVALAVASDRPVHRRRRADDCSVVHRAEPGHRFDEQQLAGRGLPVHLAHGESVRHAARHLRQRVRPRRRQFVHGQSKRYPADDRRRQSLSGFRCE